MLDLNYKMTIEWRLEVINSLINLVDALHSLGYTNFHISADTIVRDAKGRLLFTDVDFCIPVTGKVPELYGEPCYRHALVGQDKLSTLDESRLTRYNLDAYAVHRTIYWIMY